VRIPGIGGKWLKGLRRFEEKVREWPAARAATEGEKRVRAAGTNPQSGFANPFVDDDLPEYGSATRSKYFLPAAECEALPSHGA
jgi:hypothetical protein